MKRNTKKTSIIILAFAIFFTLSAFAIYHLLNKNSNQNILSKNSTQINTKIEPKSKAASLLQSQKNDIILGDKNAPITVIEYASLSCPHCADFYSDGFPKLKGEYLDLGKVKFIYRDFPLNQPALVGATIALCQLEGKDITNEAGEEYYNFLKILFRTQESWAFVENFADKLKTIAKLNGMSDEQIDKCLSSKKLQDQVLKVRLSAANLLQIQSTPTFIVNGEVISGYKGWNSIKDVIEKKLSENSN
jgi:protein-disulfide isomerase